LLAGRRESVGRSGEPPCPELDAFADAHVLLGGHPPAGLTTGQAANGAMLMNYRGDAIDLAVIIVFCRQWFIAGRPRHTRGPDLPDPVATPG
jgi:hypothetical protein